ncbi:Endonuclease/exonuclease/phosphatase [Sporodiniella umbellata]|nr:Endonuclease/exonuclease/phosphatase [Sporodiniella umbellata]
MPTSTTVSTTTSSTPSGNANASSFNNRFSQSQTLLGGTDGTTTPHLARQLSYAQISRQSSSPHHHARTAAAMARSTPVSSAVTITDPNDPTKFANGHGAFKAKKTVIRTGEENQSWTLLDMGGMGLKNISPAVCNYTFLTALYMNHNNLTCLMPSLAQLTQLRILDISGNKLTMLPPELGMLIQLRELLAFDNNLVTLPAEFGNLYQLETLGLEGNPIQADIKNMLIKDGTQAVIMSLRESAPVALPPAPREWISIENDLSDDESEKFTVLCYNILCQKYATNQAYGYTPSWALNWDYRKELILTELGNSNADIICLQEVEMALFEDHFKEHFASAGYESVFFQKTRAKTMNEKEKRVVDGCATFYRTSRFTLVKQEFVEYNQKALQRPDFKSADIYNRVMNKDNIAIFMLLEDKVTQQRVLVANTHIHWDPLFADVKLVQIGVMMEELQKFAQKHLNDGPIHYASPPKMPTVVCGDFNSSPDSGVYEFLSKGAIAQDHDDFGDHSYGTYTTDGLTHPYTLKSSYGTVTDMTFTNLTPGFKGVLDYIWYSTNTLDVSSVLGPIESDYLSKVIGFPNAHFPSDHISIMSEIKYKHNKKEQVKPADFSSTTIKNNRH